MEDRIIFLDIDYVVNGQHTEEKIGGQSGVDPEKLELLKNLVNYSPAKIVLTSSWRNYWDESLYDDPVRSEDDPSPKKYGKYLNEKFAEKGLRISGKTENIHWQLRGIEVLKWIQDHDVHRFVIFDDGYFDWHKYGLGDFWVDTFSVDGAPNYDGLTEEHIEKAKQILDEKYYK